MPNQYEIREYSYYCPKCGQSHFITYAKEDELCFVCKNKMLESPHKYCLTEKRMQENYAEFEQNEQRLFDEVISKSPEFDVNLYNNKDSILKQQQQRQQEAIEHGKAILQGRDKGNKFGIECPYCHATNVSKITVASKAVHTALFGLFAVGRNSKNYHCDHCGSDF